ncbi:ABC-type branched-chain amino acid transport system, permease component [Desulfosporosinus orientis DSM 765]|uniref:ABC-type branched-chain amino acid transport system, permease component n=1 Tax=Desulfosporosinus orientis (strain ATCC 19365 / DSM 765 / NCIMB 8382 / VKM B-1628 / Singapore I) TaxID=768706 RepID=G7WJP1_DESOD|nr:branched-chain amino acid ABC transporter permease [Desulfosporosinus orientis]AET70478.1 ABC-type branched-chain amino acid transport system, permease component [Desulfosporosinus orientis DSM 765]
MDVLLNQYYLQIAIFILINAILGVSIYMTLATGQLSLGNAGFMSIGAYTCAILSVKAGLPVYLAIPIGGIAASAVSIVIGFPALRLTGIYLAIATLGFGEVVRVIVLNLKITNGALGISGIPTLGVKIGKMLSSMGLSKGIGGLTPQQTSNLLVLIFLIFCLAFLVFFCTRLNRSRVGRAFAAIKADESAAEAMGINTTYYKLLAFALGALIAGIAGGLSAHLTFFIGPKDFAYHRTVEILTFAVLGGSDLIIGPIVGALLLTMLPELLRAASEYRLMVYGALMVIMMAFRPQGLIDEDTIRFWKRKLGRRAKQ